MGWWDEGILGGDEPLDILHEIEDVIEVGRIYRLEMFKNHEQLRLLVRDRINFRLEEYTAAIDRLTQSGWNENVITQVFAAVMMGSGANMPAEFRARAIKAGKTDEWASENDKRAQRINAYIKAVEEYEDGCPVTLQEHGLFEKILKT